MTREAPASLPGHSARHADAARFVRPSDLDEHQRILHGSPARTRRAPVDVCDSRRSLDVCRFPLHATERLSLEKCMFMHSHFSPEC